MKQEKDRTFEAKYTDENKVEHTIAGRIVKPSTVIMEEAQKAYNKAFKIAITSDAILRVKLRDFVREQGLWDDAKEEEVKKLRKQINDGELRLAKGGFKLSEARKLAIDMRKWRYELRELLTVETELDNNTAEGQADAAKLNYLISACSVYNDSGERIFKDVAEYLNPTIQELAIAATNKYINVAWNLNDKFEESLPENQFLKKWSFVNNDLRLVNRKGQLIDLQGRLIDDNGNLIDENGNKVDEEGNRVDENNRVVVNDALPFLDDDSKPITEPIIAPVVETKVEPVVENVVAENVAVEKAPENIDTPPTTVTL